MKNQDEKAKTAITDGSSNSGTEVVNFSPDRIKSLVSYQPNSAPITNNKTVNTFQ